jgi:hypothetical protein
MVLVVRFPEIHALALPRMLVPVLRLQLLLVVIMELPGLVQEELEMEMATVLD